METSANRNRDWIEHEFNREKWPAMLELIERENPSGERSLPRVLTRVAANRRGGLPWAVDDLEPLEVISFGRPTQVPFGLAFEGFYALIAEQVRRACREDTAAIVELGSGIGYNLCRIWLAGGSRDNPYLACELTESGRLASERLAALEPDFHLVAVPYDYNTPDDSALPRNVSHLVVFTSQSVEQIPRIRPEVIEGLLPLADRVSALHFGRVGWQMPDSARDPRPEGSSSAYAEANDYSRDLWPMLEKPQADRQIRIDRAERNLFGIRRDNSVSVISWEKS